MTNPLTGAAANAAGGELGKAAVDMIQGGIKSLIRDRPAREAIESGVAFERYLERACEELSLVKTILYRQPRDLMSFYEPATIVVQEDVECGLSPQATLVVDAENVLSLGNHLIIAGGAGTGKSVIMRYLFLDAVRRQLDCIPIFVELRMVNGAERPGTLVELAYQSLCRYGFDYDLSHFEASLETQNYMLLLDGLDEVAEPYAGSLREDIVRFGDRFPCSTVVVSSRMPEDGFRGLSAFVVADVKGMDKAQAMSLVGRLDYDTEARERFVDELEMRLYDMHSSFASNPLLLTMMLMVYSHQASIPDDLTSFYRQAFSVLLREHDATKSGVFRRTLKCGLADDEFEAVFSHFCFTTFMRDRFLFGRADVLERISAARKRLGADDDWFRDEDYLHDLIESVCMLQRDGLQYSFVHRSFQEYFAARYTMELDDDGNLGELVRGWLGRHAFADESMSVYLSSLSRLNRERYVRNVIYGPLRELRDECRASDSPALAFIKALYRGVSFRTRAQVLESSTAHIGLIVRPEPTYTLVCQLVERFVSPYTVEFPRVAGSAADRSAAALVDYANGVGKMEVPLDELVDAGLAEDVLRSVPWAVRMGEDAFAIIDRLEREYAEQGSSSVFDSLDRL